MSNVQSKISTNNYSSKYIQRLKGYGLTQSEAVKVCILIQVYIEQELVSNFFQIFSEKELINIYKYTNSNFLNSDEYMDLLITFFERKSKLTLEDYIQRTINIFYKKFFEAIENTKKLINNKSKDLKNLSDEDIKNLYLNMKET